MKRLVFVSTVVLAACAIAAIADHSSAKKAIQSNYDRIAVAFHSTDLSALDRILAPDFTLLGPDHTSTAREKLLRDIGMRSKLLKDVTWNQKVGSLKLKGQSAVATVTGVMRGGYNDRDGVPHVFEMDTRSIDTWSRAGKEWKLKCADMQEIHVKVDGVERKQPGSKGGGKEPDKPAPSHDSNRRAQSEQMASAAYQSPMAPSA